MIVKPAPADVFGRNKKESLKTGDIKMKRTYTAPDMQVERFMANAAVAAGCTRVEDPSTYKPVTVNCLISSSETIFSTGTSGCHVAVDTTSSGGWTIITYTDGHDYFVWKNGSGGSILGGNVDGVYDCGGVTGRNQTLLQNIVAFGKTKGYLGSRTSWNNYHVAAMNEDVVKNFRMSY